MEVIIFKGYWSISNVRAMPEYLFIYADNDIKRGRGGQAIIRDEPNTIGIPTKKLPNNYRDSFYSDDEYSDNCAKIDKAIKDIEDKMKKYKGIVIPAAGYGTGLAKLDKYAPKTLEYINLKIQYIRSLHNL